VARLFGDQRQDHEAEVAVLQEAADAAAAMAPAVRSHVAGPGMAAAVLALAVEVVVSVHR